MYNDFMDELEYAAECGFDAVCVNEHHSNGYGLMPSPNLIASSLARRTTDTAICVMGNSLALYNPPTRVAEEFAMIDCISGGRLIAGFPVGTPMDTCYAYGQNPSHAARALSRGARPGDAAPGPRRTPSPSTAASTSSATSTSGRARSSSRIRRSGFPAAARSRPGGGAPRWTTSTATCPTTATRPARRRWTGFWDEMDRLGKDRNPVPRRLPAVRRRRREPRSRRSSSIREPAEYFYGRCLHVDPRFALPPGYTTEATQRAGIEGHGEQGRQRSPIRRPRPRSRRPTMKDIVDARLRHHRLARRGGRAARREVAHNLNVGHLMLLLQFGNMSKDADQVQHAGCSPRR